MSSDECINDLPLVSSVKPGKGIKLREVKVGAGRPIIIGGPCAVESFEQIIKTAEFIKKCGGHGLRGGIFKPRSSPYSFQGLGLKGLDFLTEAGAHTGLFTVVEITAISQIVEVAPRVDVVQIGSRNMQNFELLKAVGRSQKPVLLKRGLSATIRELLQAAEYIMKEGNDQVILCERGIRTFETMTRNTLDINAIALLKKIVNLPIFADPSHGTGRSDLVIPIATAAIAAGADGLIIEVHPEPEKALSDGSQSLDFGSFQSLMNRLPLNQKATIPTKINIFPDFERFASLITKDECRYIPVVGDFITDSETPVTSFLKLTGSEPRFLLESVERGEQIGRYSFIGWNPWYTVKSFGEEVTVIDSTGRKCVKNADPLETTEKLLKELKVADLPELGRFYGGAVGYIGYDYVRLIEKLPSKNPVPTDLPDVCLIIPKYLARFDHVAHKITLIVLVKVDRENIEKTYTQADSEIRQILRRLKEPAFLPPFAGSKPRRNDAARKFSLSSDEYRIRVNKAKDYIFNGDAFQVVLSQQIAQKFTGDPFQFFRALRTINPSPYLFYLDFGELRLAGSSPEVMVRREGDRVLLKPIAGTRPRGKTPAEDARLEDELSHDEKELAEHRMLVDLGRNDLGRVCKFGSMAVTDLMAVENYSHVKHLVSSISGELAVASTNAALFRAVFPAGTLTGAPKVRAMQLIEELEPVRRGIYGGAVGYFGFNGNLDTCITIRTALFKDGKAYLQSGAGIVADSIPEREYEETMNKARAMLLALERAED